MPLTGFSAHWCEMHDARLATPLTPPVARQMIRRMKLRQGMPPQEWWETPANRVVASLGTRAALDALEVNGTQAAWVELRIDLLLADGLSVDEIADRWPVGKSALLTVRVADEGGAGNLDLVTRRALIDRFLPLAQAVDVELMHLSDFPDQIAAAQQAGAFLVGSAHSFDTMPDAAWFEERLAPSRIGEVDLVKIAAQMTCLADIETLIDRCHNLKHPFSTMGMGALGPISRVIAAQHGSLLNYGYLDAPTAPGQWSADLMVQALIASEKIDR